MLWSKMPSEASSVPGDANTWPDLCCRLGKVNHLHRTHILCNNSVCVHTIRVLCSASVFSCLPVYLCEFCLVCVSKMYFYPTYTFITDKPKAPWGLCLGEQHRAADVPSSGQICRFCTLFETQHLSVSLSQCYPQHLSLLSSPYYNLLLSFSPSVLHQTKSSANEMTSSIPNHPACHRSMLILLYPLVKTRRISGSPLHSASQSITHSLTGLSFLIWTSK